MLYTVYYNRVTSADGSYSPSTSTYDNLESAYKQFYQIFASYIGNKTYKHIEAVLTATDLTAENPTMVVMEAKSWNNKVGE